jgi:hypothetical protein
MRRGIASLALLGCLLAWQPPSHADTQDNQPRSTADKPATPAAPPVNTAPAPVQIPQPVQPPQAAKYEVRCDQAKDADEAALCDQMKATAAANWSVFQGWINLGFVFVGFIAVVWSLHLTRVATHTAVKANEDADTVLQYTAQNVAALKQSATATERMVETASATARHQLRAYVHVDAATRQISPTGYPPSNVFAKIVIKNFGQTPAYDLVFWADWDLGEIPKTGDFARNNKTPPSGPSPLAPGADVIFFVPFGYPIVAGFKDDIVASRMAIYVYGGVTYRDAFGDNRSTDFCLAFHGPDAERIGSFSSYWEGNKAT